MDKVQHKTGQLFLFWLYKQFLARVEVALMNTTQAYNNIKKILLALPDTERYAIVGRLYATMKSNSKSIELLEKCRQSKVTGERMICPKCGSATVVKNGRSGERQ